MNWVLLVVAGLFEVGWAIGLTYTQGFTRLWASVWTVAAIVVSMALLGVAMRSLPAGTAYAVWTGDRHGRHRDSRHRAPRGGSHAGPLGLHSPHLGRDRRNQAGLSRMSRWMWAETLRESNNGQTPASPSANLAPWMWSDWRHRGGRRVPLQADDRAGLKASAICVRALRFRRQLTPNPLVMVRWISPTTLKP